MWNLSVANRSPSECFVCLPGHFSSLINFHGKNSEESRGSVSSEKPVDFSPGMLSESLKKKNVQGIETHQHLAKPDPTICHLFLGI